MAKQKKSATADELEQQIEQLNTQIASDLRALDAERVRRGDLALAAVNGDVDAVDAFTAAQRRISELEQAIQMRELAAIAAGRLIGELESAENTATRRAAMAERDRLLAERNATWKRVGAATRALCALVAESTTLARGVYQHATEASDPSAAAYLHTSKRAVESYICWQLNDAGLDVWRPGGGFRVELDKLFNEPEVRE